MTQTFLGIDYSLFPEPLRRLYEADHIASLPKDVLTSEQRHKLRISDLGPLELQRYNLLHHTDFSYQSAKGRLKRHISNCEKQYKLQKVRVGLKPKSVVIYGEIKENKSISIQICNPNTLSNTF